ncbi:hypothetical protein pb186bvf_002872 [Paramecium bursaria]
MQKIDGSFYRYIDLIKFPQGARNNILKIENKQFVNHQDQFIVEFKYQFSQSITFELLLASLDKDFLRMRLKQLCLMCNRITSHLNQYEGNIEQVQPENIIISFNQKSLSIVEEQETEISFVNFVDIVPSTNKITQYEITSVLFKLAEKQIMKQIQEQDEDYEEIKMELKILQNKIILSDISNIFKELSDKFQYIKIENSKRRQFATPQLLLINEWLNKFDENIRYHIIYQFLLNFQYFEEGSKKNENISQLIDKDKIKQLTSQFIYDKQYKKYTNNLELSIQRSQYIEHLKNYFNIWFKNQNEYDIFKRRIFYQINDIEIEQNEVKFSELMDLNTAISDFYEERIIGQIDYLF